MKALKHIPLLLVSLSALILFALPAQAAGMDENQVTIINENGVTYICKYNDDLLRVFNKETGEEIVKVDFDEIEETVEDAMEGVESSLEGAFESIADLKLDLHLGEDDNYFRLDLGDEKITLDFNELFESLGEALEGIDLDGFNYPEHVRIDLGDDSEIEDLIVEIDDLKQEIRKLKQELQEKDDFDF